MLYPSRIKTTGVDGKAREIGQNERMRKEFWKDQNLRACQKEKGASKNEEERTSWRKERHQGRRGKEPRREENQEEK